MVTGPATTTVLTLVAALSGFGGGRWSAPPPALVAAPVCLEEAPLLLEGSKEGDALASREAPPPDRGEEGAAFFSAPCSDADVDMQAATRTTAMNTTVVASEGRSRSSPVAEVAEVEVATSRLPSSSGRAALLGLGLPNALLSRASGAFLWALPLGAILLDWLVLLPLLRCLGGRCCRRRSVLADESLPLPDEEEDEGTAEDGSIGEGAEPVPPAIDLAAAASEELALAEPSPTYSEGSRCSEEPSSEPPAEFFVQVGDEDAVTSAQRLVLEPWIADDPDEFAVFEDARQEAGYHRSRSRALCVFVKAFEQVHDAGASMMTDYDRMSKELNEMDGEAAYWKAMAEEAVAGVGNAEGSTEAPSSPDIQVERSNSNAALLQYLPGFGPAEEPSTATPSEDGSGKGQPDSEGELEGAEQP